MSREIEDEMTALRAEIAFIESEQHRLLRMQLTKMQQLEDMERCLHSKRCLARDLKAIREFTGEITMVEDHGYQT